MSDPSGTPTRPDGTPVPTNPQKSWWPVVAGVLCFFLLLAAGGWWYTHRGETPEAVAVSTDEDDAAPAEATPSQSFDALVAASEPAPTPTSEPVAAVTAPTMPTRLPVVSATASPTPAPDPTNCTFVNGNRPQIGDKYVLTCNEGEYVAAGEYKGGGVFLFSDFAPHTP